MSESVKYDVLGEYDFEVTYTRRTAKTNGLLTTPRPLKMLKNLTKLLFYTNVKSNETLLNLEFNHNLDKREMEMTFRIISVSDRERYDVWKSFKMNIVQINEIIRSETMRRANEAYSEWCFSF